MRVFTANENDSSQRLDKFILKVTNMPKSLIYRFLRTGHIKVNKKKKDGNYVLLEGDVISFFINDEFFKEKKETITLPDPDIVFENEDLMIINKPQGLKSQPDSQGEDAVSEEVKAYLIKKGEYKPSEESSFTPAICNRLDVNTSGLIIAAKNAEALRILNEKIKTKEIRKFYRTIVSGVPNNKKDILKGFIIKDKAKNVSKIIKTEEKGALSVETGYEILKATKDKALLEVELFTGRSHQIRAHLASIGTPIVGDFKYGGGNGKQKLCAYKLIFDFAEDSGKLNYLKGKVFEITPPFTDEI